MAGTTRHEFGGVSCFFFNNDNIKNFGDPYCVAVRHLTSEFLAINVHRWCQKNKNHDSTTSTKNGLKQL